SDGEFVARLHEAALQCPEIVLLCDRDRRSARRLVETWPQDRHYPSVLQNVEWPHAAPMASMPSKGLLGGGPRPVLTSATFTFHGLRGNLEFGVRLLGEQARAAREVLLELLRSGLFRRLDG